MGRVIFSVSVSVDGFFEGPDHDLSWHRVDEELHQHFNDESRGARAFLEGRATHQLMASYWPGAAADPDSTPVERDFAAIWCAMPKVVHSRTLDHVGWSSTLARNVDADEVRRLREEGDLSVGGPDLAATFLREGLVDEVRLYVHPVVVGAGRRPFADNLELDLALADTHLFTNGVTLLRYAVQQ